MIPHLVVCNLASVANNVHATNHLPNSEEADDLGGGDAGKGQLPGARVADTGQDVLGRDVEVLDGSRVTGDVDQGLEVGLEGGQGTKE